MFCKAHISLSKQAENHILVIVQWEITAFKEKIHNYIFGNTLIVIRENMAKNTEVSENFNENYILVMMLLKLITFLNGVFW